MSDRIRIMISSRNSAPIELDGAPSTMTELRRRMKSRLEAIQPFGEPLFEVWINEDEAEPADQTTWDASLDQVRRADVLLVLFNGDPGWAAGEGEGALGICHAELQTALDEQPGKVFCIKLPQVRAPTKKADRTGAIRHEQFRRYFETQKRWAPPAANGDEALARLDEAMHKALWSLVTRGGREARRGKYARGDALAWSRLGFDERKEHMEEAVLAAIALRRTAERVEGERCAWVDWGGTKVLVQVHAVPGAMTTAAAREKVGRPFHHDHEAAHRLAGRGRRGGPVHVIACHKGITEQQAMTLLGRPDVTTVDTPFGILAVDQVSKVQCLFLRDCRDPTGAQHGVTRMFDWLDETDEEHRLARRSLARASIVQAIAKQLPVR